ncbi:MAG: glycosyltransferase [Chloroflexi bacterium]|nr:glycosyltransferase [Chloroflexota bacterium]
MKMLMVLPYAPSLIRVRPYNLIRELARDHAVSLLIVGASPSTAELAEIAPFVRTVRVAPQTRLRAVVNCGAAVVQRASLQSVVGAAPTAARELRAMLASEPFDVVHVEHLRAAFIEAALPPEMPRIFDSVDAISLLWERTRDNSHSMMQRAVAAVELSPTRRYESYLMSRFDRVAVTSPEDADTLRALRADAPVEVIPNGVDLGYFTMHERQTLSNTLVFSGKMSYHANVTAALHLARDILPLVKARIPDVRLRIVGSDPPPIVRALAQDPSITVTGWVPDLRLAIATATVAVCPVTVKVGIQNKILEAMALEVPVVASEQGALGLQARPGEDLLVGRGAPALAEHLVGLLVNPPERERLARAGRRYVERHHQWAAAADAFARLYSEAMALRGRSAQAV